MSSAVRFVVSERPEGAYVASLKPDPAEWRLLNYVRLQYADSAASEAARLALQRDGLFSAVSTETFGTFSSVPNNPYFLPAQPSPLNK